jgi:hypothetical protein
MILQPLSPELTGLQSYVTPPSYTPPSTQWQELFLWEGTDEPVSKLRTGSFNIYSSGAKGLSLLVWLLALG